MKNDFYTYAYLRENGTPYYIGKGRGRRAFNPYGRNVHTPPVDRILFLKKNLTEEEAFKHEIYMIALYGRKMFEGGILYNHSEGGLGTGGMKGKNQSESAKRKISAGNKGKTKGIPKSEEHRKKISEALKGRKPKPASPEARRKMSEAKRGKKRGPCSEETKEKISKVKKKPKPSNGDNNVKDPIKLQKKLQSLLKRTPQLKIVFPEKGQWSLPELTAVAWVVQDFVNQNDEVIECDPLKDWIEEFKFFKADHKQ